MHDASYALQRRHLANVDENDIVEFGGGMYSSDCLLVIEMVTCF